MRYGSVKIWEFITNRQNQIWDTLYAYSSSSILRYHNKTQD